MTSHSSNFATADNQSGICQHEERTIRTIEYPRTIESHQDGELTAAAALTSLVTSTPTRELELNENDDDDSDEGDMIEEKGDFSIPVRFTKSGRKRAVSFPLKLMKVLSNKNYSEIITWMPSGKSFMILNSKAFVVQILPSFFKSAKFSSFTRKLHRWGFMKHYRGEEAGAFYHKNFQKGRLDMVEKMTCYKQDGPKSVPMAPRKPESVTPENRSPLAPRPVVIPPLQKQIPANQLQMLPPRAAPQPAVVQPLPAEQPVDLNAAIEMEVSRRLKERLTAASWGSRQALYTVNRPVMTPVPTMVPSMTPAPGYVTWAQPSPQFYAPGPIAAQMMGPGAMAVPFPGGHGLVKYEQVPFPVSGFYCATPMSSPFNATAAGNLEVTKSI